MHIRIAHPASHGRKGLLFRIGALALAATFFLVSTLTTIGRDPNPIVTKAQAQVPDAARKAAAEDYALSLRDRAIGIEADTTEEVLLSLSRGSSIAEVTALVKRNPDLQLVAATLSGLDSAGNEHLIAVLVRPGEDPQAKLNSFAQGLTAELADRAKAKLSCERDREGACQPPDRRTLHSLEAAAGMTSQNMQVYGVVVRGRLESLASILNGGDLVMGVEPAAGDPFKTPILTAAAKGN